MSPCYLGRAVQIADGPVHDILISILSDTDASPERTAELLSPYIEGGVSKTQVVRHRGRKCGCGLRAVPLGEITRPGTGSPDPVRERTAPRGWEPGVAYDPLTGVPTEITTAATTSPIEPDDYLDIVREMGAVIPDGYKVVLYHTSYDPAAWTRQNPGEDAVTAAVWRYKFRVVPVPVSEVAADDLTELVAKHKPPKKQPPAGEPDGVSFVVAYADLQIGKVDDAGGSDATVKRILEKTDLAVQRLKDLRKIGRKINTVHLWWMGDCIEGFATSQGGKLVWRNDLTPTEQVRLYRRIMLHVVQQFAPLAERVVVAVIPGNHDQATRVVSTKGNDDWATEGGAAVADALLLNPETYGHVSFVFTNEDRTVIVIDVDGTIVALAHGHQWRGINGAENWWKGMAYGLQPAGNATLMVSAHLHHLRITQSGARTWIQCPALDNGSRWFTDKTGAESPAGLLTLTVGNSGWNDLLIL